MKVSLKSEEMANCQQPPPFSEGLTVPNWCQTVTFLGTREMLLVTVISHINQWFFGGNPLAKQSRNDILLKMLIYFKNKIFTDMHKICFVTVLNNIFTFFIFFVFKHFVLLLLLVYSCFIFFTKHYFTGDKALTKIQK